MLTRRRALEAGLLPVLTVLFAVLAVVESFDTAIDDGTRQGQGWVNAVFGVLLCVPVVFCRARPVAAYVTTIVLLSVPTALLPHEVFSMAGLPPVLIVTWAFARYREGWTARWCWLPPALLPALTWSDPHDFVGLGDLAFRLVFVGGAAVAGRTMRRFAVQGAELRGVLDSLAVEEEARRAASVERERTRIAAEMHDVVAHAVTAMVVQVGAVRMEGGPERELEKLRAAESTGHRALEELRATLGLLRGSEDGAELRPLPGLEGVQDLADGLRAAGLDVDLRVSSVPLPASVALATYRILQEALTNALKHGDRGRVVARVDGDEREVRIRVENGVRRGPGSLPVGGHGLPGMRERVAMFAGSLETGARDDQYVVEAVLRIVPSPVTA